MPRKKATGTTKFGWCMTNQHSDCIITTYSGYECGCKCHKEKGAKKKAVQAKAVTVRTKPKI